MSLENLVFPSRSQLFSGFFRIGMSGFGGVLPHARRMLVDRCKWLDEREFTHLLGLGQVLPGPNIVNVAVVVGQKFYGWQGSFIAVGGLMLAPFVIVLLLASAYSRFTDSSLLAKALTAVAAGGAGLMLCMGAKLVRSMPRHRWATFFAVVTFLSTFWLRLPLLATLATLAPLSLLCAWLSVRAEMRGTPK